MNYKNKIMRKENGLTAEMQLKGMSRNKLSKMTDISLPTLRKYLNEPTLFSVRQARMINKILNVSDDYGFKSLFI
jgi:transcriptional regulator with XRE-family HTH domain